MANPQTEKGYTKVANEILEHISKTDLNGTQMRIVLVIWRYTYGFSRKQHELSLTFLSEAIDTRKSHVDRELTALIERKIVSIVGIGSRRGRVLSFNKNYEEWQERPTDVVHQSSSHNSSTSSSTTCSTISSHICGTKKESIKENIKKNTRQQKTYDEDSSYFKMALYFFDKVSAVANEAGVGHLIKKVNLQKWADDFRKLIENDGVDKHLAKAVMDWVTQDAFWKTNVLSAKKLREKFSELAIKMKNSQKNKIPKPIQHLDTRDKDIEFQKWCANGGNPDEFNWT
ncbi:phage replication protein O [Bacillus sp. OV166]|uniref:replication protein n=1 Tax=Bacillus sp. OV166 TaxID=1882763 RepID=UPI000A2ACED3|nr:replication protein [Bacillus sp. OV166]SMQ75894.1 phage replication protein O [Bacillus sp. OV166]